MERVFGGKAVRLARALAAGLLFASLTGAAPPIAFLQPQRDFEAAFDHLSTAPAYVLITVVDAGGGVEWTDCIVAPMLVGAILRERRMSFSDASIAQALRIAAASQDHRFLFHEPAALANLGLNRRDRRNAEACRLIRTGHTAFRGDPGGGEVFGGPPAAGSTTSISGAATPRAYSLIPIDRAEAARAFRIDPSYRSPRAGRHAGVEVVGAYRLALGAHPAQAYAPGYLPITVRTGNGSCFTISADYVGSGLRNGTAAPTDCAAPDRNTGENPAVPPRPGLRFVSSSWGYIAWADDRAGRTIVTTAEGGSTQVVMTVDMVVVGMGAMNSPDSPHSNISFVGRLGGLDALVTVGLVL